MSRAAPHLSTVFKASCGLSWTLKVGGLREQGNGKASSKAASTELWVPNKVVSLGQGGEKFGLWSQSASVKILPVHPGCVTLIKLPHS